MKYLNNRERGQGLAEYAFILVLVAVAAIVAITLFGESLRDTYDCMVQQFRGLAGQEGTHIRDFTLVDPDSDSDIEMLTCGSQISLAEVDNNFNITANVEGGEAGSVVLVLDGPESLSRTENEFEYTLFGNSPGNYDNGTLPPGRYTLTATPYENSGGNGEAGGSLKIYFREVD